MAKFSNVEVPARPRGVLNTSTPARTHEGDVGSSMDDKSALYTLAVTNMVGEATFYESARGRDDRFRELIHRVAASDPDRPGIRTSEITRSKVWLSSARSNSSPLFTR